MLISGSPDISVLDAQVTWDISGRNPVISVLNLSMGSGLANVSWWFQVYSPTNSPIRVGDANNVDITGVWSTKTLTDPWPKPNYAIEWSGAPYTLTLFARDTNGSIYSFTTTAAIQRPEYNEPSAKNTFGKANIYLKVIYEKGRILFEDQTKAIYKGLGGIRINSLLTVSYPIDDTGTQIQPFQLNNFSTAMVPIYFSSENYAFVAYSIYEYVLGGGSKVRIKYFQQESFAVLGNIDLSQLFCEIEKLSNDIENGSCANRAESLKNLTLINSKFMLAMTGKHEPLSGINVPKLVDEIKALGGFTCNCCSISSGIIENGASNIDGYTFDVVGHGDITGSVEVNGYNVQINVSDKKYVFDIYPGSPNDTSAFSVVNSISNDGYTKTYYLKVSAYQLAIDTANAITNNSYLLNLWQGILGSSATDNLYVDGKCIFQTTSTCNYNFVLNNVPATGTFALLSSVVVNGITTNLSHSFNLTTITALETYLNSLGIGTFSVTVPDPNLGNDIYVQTLANENTLDALTFLVSGSASKADLAKDCTGYTPIKNNEFAQYVIDYICSLNDGQIQTSQPYIVTFINENGQLQTVTVEQGSSLNDLIQALLDTGNTSFTYLQANGGGGSVSCDSLKTIFQVNTSVPNANDLLFGTKAGSCAGVSYADAFKYMLKEAQTSASTRDLFCQLVTLCGQGLVCEPYDYFETYVTPYDTSCVPIVGIQYNLS